MSDNVSVSKQVAHTAQVDFDRARRKAFLSELGSVLRRRPSALVSFEEVERLLPIKGQHYRGVQQVDVDLIVGSVNRYMDFDRGFLPTQSHTRPRWESVDIANLTDVPLPPIQLYKVDNSYFVKDGNHRVSVAKEKGMEFIDAEVIECDTAVPIGRISDQRDLLRLAEYAVFLERTQLDKLRSDACIEFTTLGRYDVLLEHISAHRWYMGIDQNRPVEWEEAVIDWYDNIYMPVVQLIAENAMLQHFPGHTSGDLYLWIMDHRWYLTQEAGEPVGAQTAALSYDENYASWTRKVIRFMQRLQEMTRRPFVITKQRIARALSASSVITPTDVSDDNSGDAGSDASIAPQANTAGN